MVHVDAIAIILKYSSINLSIALPSLRNLYSIQNQGKLHRICIRHGTERYSKIKKPGVWIFQKDHETNLIKVETEGTSDRSRSSTVLKRVREERFL